MSTITPNLSLVKPAMTDQVDQTIPALANNFDIIDSTFASHTTQLADIATNVKNYGAVGDGTTDDSTAFTNANAVTSSIVVPKGTFRISQNVTIGDVTFLNGGSITIDSGKTLTVNSVTCEPSTLCIKGAGTLVIKNNRYSLGWYEGNYANTKWDFLRRGFTTGQRKYVYVPIPKASDPAVTSGVYAPNTWAVNGALNFNDAENELVFDSDAMFTAVSPCTEMFVFSTTQKVEEVLFPKGLVLEGGSSRLVPVANSGIVIHGGARLVFQGAVRCKSFNQYGVKIDNQYFGNDEVCFDFLECTAFGTAGLYSKGNSNANVFTKINYFFSNGSISGAEAFVKIEGSHRQLSIDKFVENTSVAVGLADVSTACILIQSTPDGFSRSITIHDAYSAVSTKPVIKTGNSGGSTKIDQLEVSGVWSNAATTLLDLAYLTNSRFSNVRDLANSISVGSDCSNIELDSNTSNITGNCSFLKVNGRYYAEFVIAQDSVATLPFPTGVTTGKADISVVEDINMMASVFLRNSGASIASYAGSNINLTTGILTGTTGLVPKLNVSFNGGILYLENRATSARTVIVFASL